MANNNIKLFQEVQKYHKSMGFFATPSQPDQICRLNATNVYYIGALVFMLFPVACFSIFKAQSVYEYGITLYILVTLIVIVNFYVVFFCKLGAMLSLIAKFENIIDNRKCSTN